MSFFNLNSGSSVPDSARKKWVPNVRKFPRGVCVCVCVCLVRRNYQGAFVIQMRRVCVGDTCFSIMELSLELPLGWASFLVCCWHPGLSWGQALSVEAAAFKGSFAGQSASPGERGQPSRWSLVGCQTVAEFSLGSLGPWHNRRAHASCVCKASDSSEGRQNAWLPE